LSSPSFAVLKRILAGAIDLPATERAAYVERECAGDERLRAEVEAKLANLGRDPSILLTGGLQELLRVADVGDTPTQESDAAHGAPILPRGSVVGRYRILDVLGSGGMGVVYRAEQDTPKRIVALKLVHPRLSAPDALRRFEHEAEVLGRLQHPGIAQIHEAGIATTPFGRVPFFAMELVDGVPLTRFADEHALDVKGRLALAARLCDAVQHAHQQGVIHRDLKPDNILVTHEGQPKVLDFGVARVTDADLTTVQTDIGQLIGTLPYMSPEQATGDPAALDTRSDVYGLGVVLYELLAGRRPYDVADLMLHEAVRLIREQAPRPLSSVNRRLRGDIETIVGTALAKSPERRYGSASALAADIRRYLSSEPITARPPSAVYQLRMFARRNHGLVLAAAAVLVVLIAGTVTSTMFAIGQSRARIEAREQADTVTAVNQFLLDDLLAAADPSQREGRDVTVVEALDRAAEKVADRFADRPLIGAQVLWTLGHTYLNLGDLDAAERHLGRSLELRREFLGEDDPETLMSMGTLGRLYWDLSRNAEAESVLTAAIAGWSRTGRETDSNALTAMNNLANLYERTGRLAEADALYRRALDFRLRVDGEDDDETITLTFNLGTLNLSMEHYDEAERWYRRSLAAHKRAYGVRHFSTVNAAASLGELYRRQKRFEEAEPLIRDAVEFNREEVGPDHFLTLLTMNNLALVWEGMGRADDAESLFVETLEARRRVLGDDHVHTLTTIRNLGSFYAGQGRDAEALPLLQEAADGFRVALPGHRHTAGTLVLLGGCLTRLRMFEPAEAALVEGHDMFVEGARPAGDSTRDAIERIEELYTSWNEADPSPARERRLAEWRARLAEVD
jgi:eukaryotic-like serine/threonine-protein kinase